MQEQWTLNPASLREPHNNVKFHLQVCTYVCMFVQSVHYTINQEQKCNIRNVSEVHDVACGLNLKEEMGNKAEKAPRVQET